MYIDQTVMISIYCREIDIENHCVESVWFEPEIHFAILILEYAFYPCKNLNQMYHWEIVLNSKLHSHQNHHHYIPVQRNVLHQTIQLWDLFEYICCLPQLFHQSLSINQCNIQNRRCKISEQYNMNNLPLVRSMIFKEIVFFQKHQFIPSNSIKFMQNKKKLLHLPVSSSC